MSAEHIHFEAASPLDGSCEGYVNDAGCRYHVTKRDPRDGGIYCDAHAEAIDLRGVEGRYLRER